MNQGKLLLGFPLAVNKNQLFQLKLFRINVSLGCLKNEKEMMKTRIVMKYGTSSQDKFLDMQKITTRILKEGWRI